MVRGRHLLVMSLMSAVFCTFVKTEYIQEPPCLETKVLQSSPDVPKKVCTSCGEKPIKVQQQNYDLVPINSKPIYKQPQRGAYRRQGYVSHSSNRQKQSQKTSKYTQGSGYRRSHQQSSPTQGTSYGTGNQPKNYGTEPKCDPVENCRSNVYLLQSLTQVINNIQQPKPQKLQNCSDVPVVDELVAPQPSYQPKVIDSSKPIYKTQAETSDQETSMYHLATSKRGRPLSVNEPIERPDDIKYHPVYSKTPRVSEYSSVSSPKETQKSYVGNSSYGRKKIYEKKLVYGKAPTKQSYEISFQTRQKTNYGSAAKENQGSHGRY